MRNQFKTRNYRYVFAVSENFLYWVFNIKKLAAFYRVSLDVFDDTAPIDLCDDSDFQGDAPRYVSELSKGEKELIVRFRLLDAAEKRELLKQLKNKEE